MQLGVPRVKAIIACTSPAEAAQEGAAGLAEGEELASVDPCMDALTQK